MFKTLLSLLLVGSLAGPAFPGAPPAVAYREPNTGLTLPGKLGPLTYVGVKEYERPGLGVCIRYGGQDQVKADIFIYDLGEKNLGRGLQSPAVTRQFAQAKGDISAMERLGRYKDLEQVSAQEIAIPTPRGKILALSAVFTFRLTEGPDPADREPRVSHLILTAYQDSFIKIRFTYPQNPPGREDRALGQFIEDLGRRLDR
jgi:hypothetical protein